MNDLFGAEVSDKDKLHYAEGIASRLRSDDDVMAQVGKHSESEVMHGLFPQRLIDRVVDSMGDHETLSMELLENPAVRDGFARLVLRLLVEKREVP